MNSWTSQRLRNWVLGTVATGLLLPSVPAIGQTSNTPNFMNKKTGVKTTPAKTVEPPKLLAVPDGSSPATNNTIQPVSQLDGATGDKSEVQKQLEALYEQDGREMPKMNMNLQPLSPTSTPPMQLPPANGARSGQPKISTQLPARPNQISTQYQPRTTTAPYPNTSNGQQAQNNTSAPEAQRPPESQPSRNPVAGFFRKIAGSNKPLSTQAPVPPDFNVSVPVSTAQPSFLPAQETRTTATVTTQAPPRFPGPSARPPAPLVRQPTPPTVTMNYSNPNAKAPTTNVQTTANIASAPAELPIPISPMPQLSQQPVALEAIVVVIALPPLLTEPMPLTILAKSDQTLNPANAPVRDTASDFPNPFPEVTETEADMKITKAPQAAVALDQQASQINQPASEPQPEPTSKVDDNPYAVTAKDFAEPSIDEKVVTRPSLEKPNRDPSSATAPSPEFLAPNNQSPASTSNAPLVASTTPELSPPPRDGVAPTEPTAQTAPLAPSSELSTGKAPTSEIIPEPHIEKMRKIRERFGMKGLKGFCPVTLHDSRELVDARIEFNATHRSQKFHFASAEARDKFEADPYRYAPAAYGADVVALSRDKDVVEGTLDFAAWFKGRLYLFESQKNYETFIANPAKFATLAGVE